MTDGQAGKTDRQEGLAFHEPQADETGYFTPAVDVFETSSEILVMADMPGVELGDLDIDVENGALFIIGKVKCDAKADDYILREYRVGNYFRSFRITESVDSARISASLGDGVLRIVLPKAGRLVARKVCIQDGA